MKRNIYMALVIVILGAGITAHSTSIRNAANKVKGSKSLYSMSGAGKITNNAFTENVQAVDKSLTGIWKGDTLILRNQPAGIFPDLYFQVAGTAVQLQWKVTAKTEIAYFEVQKSKDEYEWIKLATISPENSNAYGYTYTPTSADGAYAATHFRILQVDKNNKETFSVVKVVNNDNNNKLVLYPNPVRDYLYIKSPFNKGTVEIIDISGRLMIKNNITGTLTVIPVSPFARGKYVVRVKYNGSIYAEAFLKD